MAKKVKAVEEETVPDEAVPETAEVVSETAQAVADAKARLDEATAAHEEAKAVHAEATKPPLPVVGQHCLVEGSSHRVDLPNPEEGPYPRRIVINGRNHEHVDDGVGVDEAGEPAIVWIYRGM